MPCSWPTDAGRGRPRFSGTGPRAGRRTGTRPRDRGRPAGRARGASARLGGRGDGPVPGPGTGEGPGVGLGGRRLDWRAVVDTDLDVPAIGMQVDLDSRAVIVHGRASSPVPASGSARSARTPSPPPHSPGRSISSFPPGAWNGCRHRLPQRGRAGRCEAMVSCLGLLGERLKVILNVLEGQRARLAHVIVTVPE